MIIDSKENKEQAKFLLFFGIIVLLLLLFCDKYIILRCNDIVYKTNGDDYCDYYKSKQIREYVAPVISQITAIEKQIAYEDAFVSNMNLVKIKNASLLGHSVRYDGISGRNIEYCSDIHLLWHIELLSTYDILAAQSMVNKLHRFGFIANIVKDHDGLFKVRLVKTGDRSLMDAVAIKMKSKGFSPLIIKNN